MIRTNIKKDNGNDPFTQTRYCRYQAQSSAYTVAVPQVLTYSSGSYVIGIATEYQWQSTSLATTGTSSFMRYIFITAEDTAATNGGGLDFE